MKRLSIIFLFIFVVGCASTTTNILEEQREFETDLLQKMKTWEGRHISKIVQRAGPPTQKVSDEAGGTIYIWRINPNSLPYLSPPKHIQPPLTQSWVSHLIYHQRVANQKQHYDRMNRSRQRLLSMKMMFYVRPNGTIYLANLLYL